MKSVWIVVFLLLMTRVGYAQTKAIDSIRRFIYPKNAESSYRESLFYAMTLQRSMNLDTLGKYIHLAVMLPALTVRERMQLDVARVFYYTRLGQSDSSVALIRKNLALLKRDQKDILLLTQYYFLNAGVLLRNNDHKLALENYYDALSHAEKAKNINYQIKSLNGVGWVYMEMFQYAEAIKWFEKALHVTPERKYESNYSPVFNNLASSYGALDQIDSAKYYTEKAIAYSIKYEDYFSEANALVVKANIALYENRAEDGVNLLKRAVTLRKVLNDPFYILSDLCILSDIYASIKKTDEGLATAQEAMAIARKYNIQAKLPMIYISFEMNYKQKKDYRKLSEIFEQHLAVKDSVYQKALAGELAEMETRYGTEKKEKEIANQRLIIQQERNTRKIILFGLLGTMASIAAGAILYFQRSKARAEKRQFRSILDAEQKERIRIARDLHDSIGQMLSVVKMNVSNVHYHAPEEERKQTANTLDIIDKTIQEVRHISHNLIPEELNFGIVNALEELCGKINGGNSPEVNLIIDEGIKEMKLSKEFELSLYRIVQEILGNMLKHAEANIISVIINSKDSNILLELKDNGKGFDTRKIKDSNGLGWKNILARVNLLNGKMQVYSEKTSGTQIEISIPR